MRKLRSQAPSTSISISKRKACVAAGVAVAIAGTSLFVGVPGEAGAKSKRTTRKTKIAKPKTTQPTLTSAASGIGTYQVDTRTETFVDSTRPTPKNGTAPALPSRTLRTLIFTPKNPGKKLPLVVFGHGLGGEPESYKDLLTAFSSAGYVIAAPAFPLSNAKAVGGVTFLDQPGQAKDISFVITQIIKDPAVDADKILVAGHSLGGITVVDLLGNPQQIDSRVDAAIVLAGTTNVLSFAKMFEGTPSIPALFMHGDVDETVPYNLGVTTFQKAKTPKWFLTVVGGSHSFGILGAPDKLKATAAVYVDAMTRFANANVGSTDVTASLQELVDANTALLKLESKTK
jgi:fermentation-respiration switch protein FrsA (DUF1100 family)